MTANQTGLLDWLTPLGDATAKIIGAVKGGKTEPVQAPSNIAKPFNWKPLAIGGGILLGMVLLWKLIKG